MKVYKTNEIKNLAMIGGKGSGKTTLAEAMLNECGAINRRGTVENGNTVSDNSAVEKEYGYSVYSSLFYTEVDGRKLNFFDCPGGDDFVGSAVTSLAVSNAAALVLDYGVEVGTNNSFRVANGMNKPIAFVVNKCDGDKADFENTLSQLKDTFGNKVVTLQFPVNAGPGFNAIVDVLTMKQYTYKDGKATVGDIDASVADKAEEYHDALLEMAAEGDEELMMKYLDEMTLNDEETILGVRKGMADCSLYPVLCCSADKNVGVDRLMQVLGIITPQNDDLPAVTNANGAEVKLDENGPVSLFFFKSAVEPNVGTVSYFKVMSGTLKSGTDLTNSDRGSKERLAQINIVRGNLPKTAVDELHAGDLGVAVKLKDVRTGNALNDKGCDHTYNFITYPNPKYQRAVKAINESETEKLGAVLNRIHEEDPTLLIEQSKELKQTILSGQGEFHLRTVKWIVENIDKIQVEYAEPKIPYRETITKASRADYRHKKQSGGSGQFGEVHLIVEPYKEGMPEPEAYKFGNQEFKMNVKDKQEIPLEWGGKLVVYNCIVGGAIDARFIPAIVKGLMDCMEQGPLTGSYAKDVRVCIYDGKMHPVDSNEISFRLAARHAFSEAFRNATPKVMEPIYDVEILVPDDAMGGVQSDLQGRRGIMMDMSSQGGMQCIKARIPLKEMGSYSTSLSSITGGRGSFNMKFFDYNLVPADVQTELIKAYDESKQEEE